LSTSDLWSYNLVVINRHTHMCLSTLRALNPSIGGEGRVRTIGICCLL